LEKATVKRFSGVFLKLVNLTAVICILCLIADIARPVRNSGNSNEQGKSSISNGASTKSDGPIILLSSTVIDVKSTRLGARRDGARRSPEGRSRSGTGGSVLNESEKKAEPEAIKPENTTKKQSNNSESNTESNIESNTEQPEEWQSIQMRVTAYCPCPKCCGEYSDGVTACGHEIQPGDTFVAADRRYPFRTEMLIPGYSNSQPVKVLDRGGAIKGNRLDVFFATHQDALEWGVKYLEVNVRNK
jgi:3D (Asp-Asp-Asp) domain-containing protein